MVMTLLSELAHTLAVTLLDVAPIAAILLGFQFGILRQRIANLRQVMIGSVYVVLGLGFFLFGLEHALFPIGRVMATQLTDPAFAGGGKPAAELAWYDYYWTYLFAFAIGFATTIAEPALIAVALKARDVSDRCLGAASRGGPRGRNQSGGRVVPDCHGYAALSLHDLRICDCRRADTVCAAHDRAAGL
jgi:hypothetical protein